VIGEPRALLRALFDVAVAAAMPARCVPPHLPPRPQGRTIVVGAGTAAAAMARAVEEHWDGPLVGAVVTRQCHEVPCERIEVMFASHPLPHLETMDAAYRILNLVKGAGPEDLVLCLLSGGGSALLSLPPPRINMWDKVRATRNLLHSTASIAEINCVRKHVSRIKGGRLALACPRASLLTLAISDVPGDDPSAIASGPTVADPTTREDALAVLARHHIAMPRAIERHLHSPACETPKPGDPRLAHSRFVIVASARDALAAAAEAARMSGVTPVVLGDDLEGEARDLARDHAGLVRDVLARGEPARPPCVLLSGGETTVTLRGNGRGGRNGEYLLALAVALEGAPGVYALACDTDGIDGTPDSAGAVISPDTLARAGAAGVDADAALDRNDSHGFFEALGDRVITEPTRTNVNDFRAILVTGNGCTH
jgi:hydroxypyruvate reductase